jgi:hypothetical protein
VISASRQLESGVAPAEDPLACGVSLPLRARYYPMGVPVEIATNSEAVFATAERMWARYPIAPGGGSITFRIAVTNQDAAVPPLPAMPLGQGHLVSIVHGPGNFAVCDLNASFGFAWLTRDVANESAYLRYHFLEPALYVMIEARYLSPLHASCIALDGRALVLCGDSGAGKTTLAYACAKMGWTYLSDDATHIVRGRPDRVVVGRPFSIRFRAAARKLFPELDAWLPELRPNGKLDLEIDTSELGLTIALESNAFGVVFLNRRESASHAQVAPFAAAEALRQFSKAVCFGDQRLRAKQIRALQDFTRLPIVELTYGDLSGAEKLLRAMVS